MKQTYDPFILEYKPDVKLHYVNIYLASPTFERETNDKKANFETKLSTIGGIIGLCAGFSILSGVEIVYYVIKIFLNHLFCSRK